MNSTVPFTQTIVTATGPEFQAVFDQLEKKEWICDDPANQFRDVRGFWRTARVQLLQCGLGPVTFGRNFERSEIKGSRVSMIGICGALRDGLKTADVMLATHVTDQRSGELLVLPESDRGGTEGFIHGALMAQFLCFPQLAETENEKRNLGLRWGCDVVDMESAPFVKHCRALGVQCMVLKSVSDDVSHDLPPLNRARRDSGDFDLPAMAHIWKNWEKAGSLRENLYVSLRSVLRVFETQFLRE